MKKKIFRERNQLAQTVFDMSYNQVIESAKEIGLEKEIETIIDKTVEEKPKKRGRKKNVKSDK